MKYVIPALLAAGITTSVQAGQSVSYEAEGGQ